MKIYFIEETDMYGDKSCGMTAYCDEQEANQIEKKLREERSYGYSYMVQELEVKFSHRNGEKEPPTQEGFFWVKEPHDEEPVPVLLRQYKGYLAAIVIGNEIEYDLEEFPDALWWGPIPTPEIK